ncbi:CDP-glycerol glycerophosphotransferase family protein [Halalkalicoccus ordinarius]|uniref:CDP-glycerol glycerophosphotransferase family protein n=1 Tax=Halalkalicoccus ordinarius TaxID=3116651 RepID=UPI00300E9EA8
METKLLADLKKLIEKVSIYDPFIVLLSFISPRIPHLWTFESAKGERFDGNSKYLYLHCENKENIRNIWISSTDSIVARLRERGFEAYNASSLKGRYYLLRSGASFSTHGPNFWRYLFRSNLVFLHHGIPLKTMNEDDPDESSSLIHRYGDLVWRRLFLTTSMGKPFELFKSAFRLTKSHAIVGRYPRTDPFFKTVNGQDIEINSEFLQEVKEVHQSKKTIFYTPTFRKNRKGEINAVDHFLENRSLQELNDGLSESDAHLYISLHPMRATQSVSDSYSNISTLKTGGDIYPYLRFCDLMITDYSSIFYDYLLLNRPIVFFAPDAEEYEETHGMYFDYHQHVPGPVVETIPALIAEITKKRVADEYQDIREEMREEYYTNSELIPSEETYQSIRNKLDI